jgi:TonB-dependent SusC/RagA subfamily outer membrane receptor
MKIKLLFFMMLSFLCVTNISAQKNNKKITITGTVLDADSIPIPNSIIMIDGEKTNSVTNSNGEYKIKVKPTAQRIGIFTFGSGFREEAINGRTNIIIRLSKVSAQKPDEVNAEGEQGVGVGYANVKKKNVTTQVSSIDGTNKKYASYSTIGEMIQREIPGVKISGSTVVIQDSKDFFGSVPALIVVDGAYMNGLPDISPIQVKSIEVLKGASAAIYGSRGYGGVILIKTKIQNDK